MTKHPIEPEELMAYLDGELLLDRAAAAADHLENCRDCQRLAADFQGLSRRLMAWQVSPPEAHAAPSITATAAERPKRFRLPWNRRWAPWALGLAAVALAVLVVPIARRPARLTQAEDSAPGSISENGARLKAVFGTREPAASPAPQQAETAAPLPNGPMIVRTAQLTFVARDFDHVRAALEDILKRHGGYAGELNVNSPTGGSRTLTATLRVPADHLDAAMAELKKLGRVETESQGGEEVTHQYVDLEARLANARHTEQRLTELLHDRTGKLSDVLAVEVEIGRVRGEIERMEAEKKTLLNQVSFGTLNLMVSEDYKAQLVPDSTFARFRNAAVGGYRTMAGGVVNVALFIVSYGPSLLLLAGLLFAARFGWRRLRRSA